MTRPCSPGIYHLVVAVPGTVRLRIGRLGIFTFPAGHYVYTGSAMGGLGARLARHRSRPRRLRWHIDYLLRRAEVVEVVTVPTRRRIECARNRRLLSLPGARVVVPGFGSSDCRCPSHLVYLASRALSQDWRGRKQNVAVRRPIMLAAARRDGGDRGAH